jgi:hypothetical protein
MKRTSWLVVLLVLGVLLLGSGHAALIRPAILCGAYDELLPEAVKGKTFVPSFKIKWEYDDNIYTTTDLEKKTYGAEEEESWKLYVEPKLDIHVLSATSYLGLSYQFSMIYYTDRADDDTDIAHDALLDVRHRFSPVIEVALRDLFRQTEEPEIAEDIVTAGGIRTIPYQRNGDYAYNQASVGLNIQPSPQVAMNVSYANLLVDYDEGDWVIDDYTRQPRRGASYYFDRMAHTIGTRFQYIPVPESKINAGVSYSDIDYDVDAVMKDSEAWIAYVGLDQSLSKRAVGSIMAGWQNRDFSDVDMTEDAPFVDVSLGCKVGKKGNGKIGYRYGLAETEHAAFGVEEAHTFYAGLNAWPLPGDPRLSVHVHTSYEMADFDASTIIGARDYQDRDEDAWLLGLVLRYQVVKNMYLEGGYRRTDVDSDFEGSVYERNRYFVGLGGIF